MSYAETDLGSPDRDVESHVAIHDAIRHAGDSDRVVLAKCAGTKEEQRGRDSRFSWAVDRHCECTRFVARRHVVVFVCAERNPQFDRPASLQPPVAHQEAVKQSERETTSQEGEQMIARAGQGLASVVTDCDPGANVTVSN